MKVSFFVFNRVMVFFSFNRVAFFSLRGRYASACVFLWKITESHEIRWPDASRQAFFFSIQDFFFRSNLVIHSLHPLLINQ